ncbi:MAG: hypothetical protein A3D31_04600 [Candidatus Fluviicola riflensis]|nr:MAG: hypothetical protein CHH17_10420 [Candidatus Fluviicola riflensis]OGS79256.1 MAG: hypothetical protein A3D31_04600 [Candidatus Fluviicola riflensis]OGS86688.1 MAG: hypothetical protein A2724_04060 [Fluviicola sp. RIFCSPHIGHO2_01_FULL_43_53]OGS88838.1 MAG: hypothetical protein A3E30_00600 [Fluviicola sp. RIFCSPHIGHO2_12_FULL_43_24]
MDTAKSVGIWMDYSKAHVMEFTTAIKTVYIESEFTSQEKEKSLAKGEKLMHNKEQHLQAEYYKKLEDIIKNHEEVLLFGPSNAKSELANLLRANHLYSNIKIDVVQADKMTTNQEHAFVRHHFSRH